MYEDRSYAIFAITELDKIDFSQILETNSNTLRLSVDQTKSFIKWEGEEPTFISNLTTLEGPYTYQQILDIIMTAEWTLAEE